MKLKPGNKAPASGQYEVIGSRGEKINHEVTVVKGEPLPPTQRQGKDMFWLIQRTINQAKN